MAKVNIKKMSVIALQRDKDLVLSYLQKLGCAEFLDIEERLDSRNGSENLRELRDEIHELDFALDFLSRFNSTKKSIFDQKPAYTKTEMEEISRGDEVKEIVETCRKLENNLGELKSREMKLNNTIESLEPWQGLDLALEDLGETKTTIFQVGSIPDKKFENLKRELAELPASYIERVGLDREQIYVFLAYHKNLKDQINELTAESGWTRQELPQVEGTPAQALARARESLDEIEDQRGKIREKAKTLGENYHLLEVAYDYYQVMMERESAAEKLAATDKVFYLEGWVPEPETERVKNILEENTDGIYITFTDPSEDEDVPTVVNNPRLVEPFELITDLYSPPGENDIDPNLFMTPFFFAFFGMMLSDAGYGIVLTVLGYLALKLVKPEGMGKKLFELIFLGGISTFIWGAIYGGWFGDLITLPPLWINPLEDPIAILLLSFVMGGIQIYVALGLKAYKNIKEGKTMAAFFDQGFWIVFLTGFVMLVFPATKGLAKYVVIAGAVGLVLTQGRQQENIFAKFGAGLLSLYDVTSYLSDVLSYSRIMALGLATGVIATVVNTMARLIGVNIVGYIAMVLVLIVGHLFNIAINSLGAYVHTSRLQYVEFFSKFYEGGGRSLDPLAIKTKYVNYKT